MDRKAADLFSGTIRTAADIEEERTHQIKIYLSCTFTDFGEERDAIISRVIPKIRELAKEKYGFEFHYMDLKWGMQCPNNSDLRTRELMLKELLRAQQLSAGPCYVAFLGQKYGEGPLPQLMLSQVLELIQRTLFDVKGRRSRNANLISKWYKQDENNIPPVHVLMTPNGNTESVLKTEWLEEKDQLRSVMLYGVELCCKHGTLPPEALRSYFASDLENEIRHGLLREPAQRVLVFRRSITDLQNYVAEARAHAFTDIEWNEMDEKWEMKSENKYLLESLLEQTIGVNVPSDHISEFSILWRYDTGVHRLLHSDYLDLFCQQFHNQMMKLIDDAAAVSRSQKIERSPIFNEVATHWKKTFQRGLDCQGRDQELTALIQYLTDTDNSEIFTLYGESGCGKTTILAKLQLEMASILPKDTVLLARYLGLTTESSDLRVLLYSLCHQLKIVLNLPTTLPNDFVSLQKLFKVMLNDFPVGRHLVIILDSLDQLQPDYGAFLLHWLPRSLPNNVKMIISILPHSHGMMTHLKTEMILNPSNFLEVRQLSVEAAMQLILRWLYQENMCITNAQAKALTLMLRKCSLPLYIKMIFQRVKQWRSFDDPIDTESFGGSCEAFMNNTFSKLESELGQVFVHHAVAYLTASKTGLSDTEMEDLLSLDENVMRAVFRNAESCVRRCPPFLWVALRDSLEPYLLLKSSDDVDVYFWHHRLFSDFAEKRYLNSPDFTKAIHSLIADYYLGKWHARPLEYKDKDGKVDKADRFVLSQPLTYRNSLGETQYNKRKYDQVPRQLFLSGRLDELNSTVMFNYDWLYNKIKVLSMQHILADLALNPGLEASLLEDALRAAQPTILKDMNNLPTELSGRLLPYYQTHKQIRGLIQQCDRSGLQQCALAPSYNYQQVPGSPLKHSLGNTGQVDQLYLTHEGRYLLMKAANSQMVRTFDLATGESKDDILTSFGHMYKSHDEQKLVIVDNEIEKAIKIHSAADGQFLGQLIPYNYLNLNEQSKYNMGQISVTDKHIAILVTSHTTHLCIASIETCEMTFVTELPGRGNVVKISPNNRFVLCNAGLQMHAFSTHSPTREICLTHLENKPSSFTYNEQGTRVYITSDTSSVVTMVNLDADGCAQMISKASLQSYFLGDRIHSLTLSHNQQLLLLRGLHNIAVYDVSTDKVVLSIKQPPNSIKEFRMPKQNTPTPIVYSEAIFSSDDRILITSLFRSVQFWDLRSGKELDTSIQAPVGIIQHMLLSPFKGQIITLMLGSDSAQVWSLDDYVLKVTNFDRLTSQIRSLTLTNTPMCFATGIRSDEVGVFDTRTGHISHLLTHEAEVLDILPVADGSHLFVTVDPAKSVFCNKIWSVHQRSIIKEFGCVRGKAVSLRNSNTIIHISQRSAAYQAPYHIFLYRFLEESFTQTEYDFVINYCVSEPFITAEDTYMVLLTSDTYLETLGRFSNPSICCFHLKGKYTHKVYGITELEPFLNHRYLIEIIPIQLSTTDIIVLYKQTEASSEGNGMYGFFCMNLATGSILRYSDNFMPLSTNLDSLCLSLDGSFCIHIDLGLRFDMRKGELLSKIGNCGSPISLMNQGRAVAYYSGSMLFVERIRDNEIIAKCDVHVGICHLQIGYDDLVILVGCVDGTLLSFVLIDKSTADVEYILATIPSRVVSTPNITIHQNRRIPSWDAIEGVKKLQNGLRPASAFSQGKGEREILQKIRPVHRPESYSRSARTTRSLNNNLILASASYDRSKTCRVM